ncbi:ECF RNA polymerase sigma factor SigE [Aquisphaera giovannonii]|uniref:ECF RNA polymerase sigma factor SigE n=1 Tax=Aquisphaera giovannonii TaxID=406548 RepID=A0A5B9W5M5_9BACT|nr:sigma-70 family RNA polymerase sigma factor [Aquisphaera giovannonii]QEH35976.1 ECF RNA polymerase sigma factor SigE [Aquisphaera giovannonii]
MAIEAMGSVAGPLNRLIGAGSLVGLGDGELLERFLSDRDEEAFAAIVTRHGPMVLRVCRGVLRNASDAEDAFQATFLILVRKARSLRGYADVGGWLHRVAYRVAIQANADAARRRTREREAGAMAEVMASGPAEVDEVTPAVHEELARLPEAIRSALVLCELRGMPQQEAAAALRTSERTLRRRLSQGRERLKARLARRGLAGGEAVILAARLHEAEIIVPPAWREAAARAAVEMLGATVSGGVASAAMRLAEDVSRTRLALRSAFAMICVAGLVVTAWAAAVSRGGQGRPTVAPAARREEPAAGLPPVPYDGSIEVKGRVVDPDGKAVGGADVRASWGYLDTQPILVARAGADGRFVVNAPWPRAHRATGAALPLTLAASASGFGPGWVRVEVRPGAPGMPELRLVRDGPPIEGRIVNRAGWPVAGATVKVETIWYGANEPFDPVETGDLGPWLRDVRSPEPGRGEVDHLTHGGDPRLQPIELPAACVSPVVTDADGRFRLSGVGRERVATLSVSGEGVATASIPAMCRDEPDIRIDNHFLLVEPGPVVHGRRFEHVVEPGRSIGGTIRDAGSGRPVVGLPVCVGIMRSKGVDAVFRQVASDDRGHYRFDGLPEARECDLMIRPGEGQPYVSARFKVAPAGPAKGSITFDLSLKRGILVRGRVTDRGTGRPAKGIIYAFALRENPHLGEYPGFGNEGPNYTEAGEDGRFQVVTLPGPGLITCLSGDGRHVIHHKGATIPATVPEHNGDFHAMARVKVDPDAPPTVDLQVIGRKTLDVRAVDDRGQPVSGARMWGPGFAEPTPEQDSPTFEAVVPNEESSRRVTILHDGRKLIGSVELKPDEAGPVTVRLVPWGMITGRIVDQDGRPGGSLSLLCFPDAFDPRQPANSVLARAIDGNFIRRKQGNPRIKADADGRFRVEGIVPGVEYQALLSGEGEIPVFDILQNFEVQAGEVKDLGDLVVQPRRGLLGTTRKAEVR